MDLATAVLDKYGYDASNRVLSDLSGVPASTLGHRKHGRKSGKIVTTCIEALLTI